MALSGMSPHPQRGSREPYGLPAIATTSLSLFGNAGVGRGRHLGCVAIGCTAQNSAGKLRDWRGREQKTTEWTRDLIVQSSRLLGALIPLLSPPRADGMPPARKTDRRFHRFFLAGLKPNLASLIFMSPSLRWQPGRLSGPGVEGTGRVPGRFSHNC